MLILSLLMLFGFFGVLKLNYFDKLCYGYEINYLVNCKMWKMLKILFEICCVLEFLIFFFWKVIKVILFFMKKVIRIYGK